MPKITRFHGLMIDKKQASNKDLFDVKMSLTVMDEVSKEFFYEDDNYLYLPHIASNIDNFTSYYISNNFEIVNDERLKYFKKELDLNKWKMKIEPRNDIQRETISFLLNSTNDNKSLFLSPGTGKTALSIMYFINKGIVPLIIAPDFNILQQWIESILNFTYLTEEDLLVLDKGSKSFDDKNFDSSKKVYLCCIKTLAALFSKYNNHIETLKTLWNGIIEKGQIDLKVFDECHLNLAAIFKTTTWLPSKENLFLSGTMNRRILHENIIHPGIVEPKEVIESTEYEIIPELLGVIYDSKPSTGNVKFCQDLSPNCGFDYNRYFNNYLLSSKNKNKLEVYLNMLESMVGYYVNLKNENGYQNKLVLVSFTIKMLDEIYNKLSQKFRVKRIYGKFKEKPSDNNFDIIIGTNKSLTAGFDHKELNVMISTFMNTSSHNVKQLVGRICRSAKDKPYAKYICLVDNGFSMCRKYFEKHAGICQTQLSKENELTFYKYESKAEFPIANKED